MLSAESNWKCSITAERDKELWSPYGDGSAMEMALAMAIGWRTALRFLMPDKVAAKWQDEVIDNDGRWLFELSCVVKIAGYTKS